jgi:hypothetical protein
LICGFGNLAAHAAVARAVNERREPKRSILI